MMIIHGLEQKDHFGTNLVSMSFPFFYPRPTESVENSFNIN